MKIGVKFKGKDALMDSIRELALVGGVATSDYLNDVAFASHRFIQEGMSEGGRGQLYPRRGGRVHRASSRSQMPQKDMGRLASSVRVEPARPGPHPVARLGTNVEYGRHLELKPLHLGGRRWLNKGVRLGIRATEAEYAQHFRNAQRKF